MTLVESGANVKAEFYTTNGAESTGDVSYILNAQAQRPTWE